MRSPLRNAEPSRARGVVYPESDGRPMSETDVHGDAMRTFSVDLLRGWFADEPDVYVSGNNFLYFVEGNPKRRVSPDCYVVKGVPARRRNVFKLWEEGRGPCFVLEVTSKKTRRVDREKKLAIYRDVLHVPEYFLFDPRVEWLGTRLTGYRLVRGDYRPIAARPSNGRLESRALGLELGVVDGNLRFFEPGAATPIPTWPERAESERARADRERARADALAAEVARLRRRRRRG